MKIKVLIGIIGLAFAFSMLIPLISAEIILSQPSQLYNYGDDFNITVTLSPAVNRNDFFIATISCNGNEAELHKSPESMMAGNQKTIVISSKLKGFIIGNLTGDCIISAKYGDEHVQSQKFQVTRDIKVSSDISGIIFNPGDSVQISGNAVKANGQELNGFVEVRIEALNLTLINTVKEGAFNFNFTIPKNSLATSYDLFIKAYEKDESDFIANLGEDKSVIKVKQIIKNVDVALNTQSVSPKGELVYTVLLYDQAGQNGEGDISVAILSPDKSIFQKVIVKAGEANTLGIAANYTPGYWSLDTKFEGLETNKMFYVEELEEISSELENNTLILTNVGNVPFNNPIEVKIGESKEVVEVSLAVGEIKKLRLVAPDGEYGISVNDGKNSKELGSAFLTGRAISVDEFGKAFVGSWVLWIWIGIIVLLAIITLYLYIRVKKRTQFGSTPSMSSMKRIESTGTGYEMITSNVAKQSSEIEKGRRENCSIIALKIKNLSEIEGGSGANNPMEAIDRALLKAKGARAKVYVSDAFRIMIFCPSLTRDKNNELKAITVAREIQRVLEDYNKVAKNRINFGIGINSGEMIVESENGKLKFVSATNALIIAKKISEASNSNPMLSDSIRKATLGNVKADKNQYGYWEVKRIVNREGSSEFIDRFMDRQRRG